jgi:GTP-binding protein SAR1
MGFADWFTSPFTFLESILSDILGFDILGLFRNKKAKILFLGLDNAGKTTFMYMLKCDMLKTFTPTVHPGHQEVIIGSITFQATDLGGHETARRIWGDYFANVDGVFFIVDAADRSRFPEANEELGKLLNEPGLREVPFVILGNKIDIPTAASEDELRQTFNLHTNANHKHDMSRVEVFMCSIKRKMGYSEAFKWLEQFIH